MREIKFRVWNEELEKMYELRKVNYYGSTGITDTYIGCDKAAWMQYTGLKDKNGVDIYEGDILTKKSFWPFYIGFENGCFVQIPCNKIKRKNRLEFSRINTYVKEFELVGNIYENPDLVEV